MPYDYIQEDDNLKPCYAGLGHHGTAHPKVDDVGDSFQVWRLAVNILSKQSRTADKGGFPTWGLGDRLANPHRKK
jgi:hypothetical protein